jgi:hypothetical protein
MLFPKENAKARERWLRKILAQEGMKRALSWGWPNTYTYTKSLAESLLFEKSTGVVFSIVRPSIVESAVQFPFPGWNEGFNTTGPLIYLVSTGYRDLPARPYHTLDLIPVDYLCNAMLLNAGALLRGEHQLIYQIGTSDRNPLYLERTAELTSLGHRKYLRKHGKTFAERFFLSRLNTRLRNEDSPFSVASFKKWTQGIEHLAADFFPLAWQEELQKVQEWKKGADRLLKFAEKIIETYKPYTYDVAQTFECRAIQAHIPQEAIFQCPIEALDWYRYFIDIHVPGLRKWCFPLLEGQAIEKYSPLYRFSYRPSSSSLSKLTPEEVL